MKKDTEETLELKLVIGGDGQVGRTGYFVSHPPSERYIYFVGDDLNLVRAISGRQEAITFIINEKLGTNLTLGNREWESEYDNQNPSSKLADALIQEVFIGNPYDYIKPHVAVQKTFDIVVSAGYFDAIFEDEKKIRKLKKKMYGSKLFELERQQFSHAKDLINRCNDKI